MRPVFRCLLIFICICHFDALNFPYSQLPRRRVHPVAEQHAVQVVGLVLQAPGGDLRPHDWTGSPQSVKPLATVFSRRFTS